MRKLKKITLKSLSERQFFVFLAMMVVLIASLVFLLGQPSSPPRETKLTNVTDSSLAISWLTDRPTKGKVILIPRTARLWRPFRFLVCRYLSVGCLTFPDEIGRLSPATTHYVFVKNLQPETAYYYRILVNGRLWKYDQAGHLLPPLKTGPILRIPSAPEPVYSCLYEKDGQSPVKRALVYLSLIDGQNREMIKSQPLMVFTDEKGRWLADWGNWRSFDLREMAKRGPNDLVFMKVWTQDGRRMVRFFRAKPSLVPKLMKL